MEEMRARQRNAVSLPSLET